MNTMRVDCTAARCLKSLSLAAALGVALPVVALAQEEGDAAPPPMTQEEAAAKYKELLEQGSGHVQAGEFPEAVAALDQAIRMAGGSINPQVSFLRARALFGIQEFDAAISDLKDALNYGQDIPGLQPEVRHLRAQIYLEQGAPDRALRDAVFAVKANRANPQYQLTYGKALQQTGDPVNAEKALSKYIAFDDQTAEPYFLRAQTLVAVGKYPRATVDIDRAIELDPSDHEHYYWKALIYAQDDDYAGAAEALRLALENYEPADPELPQPYSEAYLMRASMLEEYGKKQDDPAAQEQAFLTQKQLCEELLEELGDEPQYAGLRAATLFRLGVAERLLGNFVPAVKAFTQAMDLNPGLGEAYFRRGICFFYLQEPDLALGDFEKGAALNLASPRSNLWIGRCKAQLGDYREAIKAYSAAIAVSDRYTLAYVHRGLAYMHLSEFSRAIEDFNDAIRLEPGVARHYHYRGLAFRLWGEPQRAVDSQIYAIRIDPEFVDAYDEVATVLDSVGKSELANKYRQRAAQVRSQQSTSGVGGGVRALPASF